MTDKDNYKIYVQYKDDMERKRLIDGNKFEIVTSF